jgi:hypothetical protein
MESSIHLIFWDALSYGVDMDVIKLIVLEWKFIREAEKNLS